jgi:hypothetical protein
MGKRPEGKQARPFAQRWFFIATLKKSAKAPGNRLGICQWAEASTTEFARAISWLTE